ncbi:carbonic anhydrase [Streptomyces sp. CG 926]|uniref:carbonic anhydrase n=1 Tax=Streptomyces sp. CG 926 TaxID=1882405 RepID=UPI000D6CB277|nr:carbonic anhydrase [Streptomyces sp. CG 926]PWK65089.1 carbonic anhydrase [Streptomyces sp. CG 926]
MQSLIDHARAFPVKIAETSHDFSHLARGQRPMAAFVSCSDSRVIPSLITGARPGELFEVRTAGNIVPRYRASAACAVAASLEFAVKVLKVPDIVVCGHSHCGAVQGLMHRQSLEALPLMQRWLVGAGRAVRRPATDRIEPVGADPVQVAQAHLLAQLDHLRSYPWVSQRLVVGRLRLHAWYYTVDTGEVLACQPGSRVFRRL